MAATLHRFRSKKDRLTEEQGQEAKQLLLAFATDGGLPQEPLGRILAAIDSRTASTSGWTFIMLSPHQNAAVCRWIATEAKRPIQSSLLWSTLFTAMRMDTGEICLSRDELAEMVGTHPRHISTMMTELEKIGAITRRKAGRTVRYFMNPNVATCLTGKERDQAQAEVGPVQLTLLQGGAA